MNRRIIIVIAVATGLVIAAVATRGFGIFPRTGGGELTLHGNVDIREVDMAFRVGGRISGIAVEEGAKVKQGQTLATLDTATLDSRIGEADAQLAQAQAQLAKLRNGNRSQDIAQARARVAAAQAVLENSERDYRRREPLVGQLRSSTGAGAARPTDRPSHRPRGAGGGRPRNRRDG